MRDVLLDPEELDGLAGLGLWTRGLLIRRRLGDGALAHFTTWCPKDTPLDTLVRVEGRRWAIEDAFETAKTELGLASQRNPQLARLASPRLAGDARLRHPGRRFLLT